MDSKIRLYKDGSLNSDGAALEERISNVIRPIIQETIVENKFDPSDVQLLFRSTIEVVLLEENLEYKFAVIAREHDETLDYPASK